MISIGWTGEEDPYCFLANSENVVFPMISLLCIESRQVKTRFFPSGMGKTWFFPSRIPWRPTDGKHQRLTWCFASHFSGMQKNLVFTRCFATCLCIVCRTQKTRFLPGLWGGKFPRSHITKKGLESKGRGLKSSRFCDILPKKLVFPS